jgi:hypothetical protein
MKPSAAKLLRQARAARQDRQRAISGAPVARRPYREQPEGIDVAPPVHAAPADPDGYGAGLRAHYRLQNRLAQLLAAGGLVPLSPGPNDPPFDLAWSAGDGALVVVEVKSTTPSNEVKQLRMGLGQVLDYANTLRRTGVAVQPVLYVEQEPVDAERWLEITNDAGIQLIWLGTEDRLRLG